MINSNKSLKGKQSSRGQRHTTQINIKEEEEEEFKEEYTEIGSINNLFDDEERNFMSGNTRDDGQAQTPNDQGRKRMRRIKHRDLLTHLVAVNEAQISRSSDSRSNRKNDTPPQIGQSSPTNQNLSYYQQQQLQRTGGLQRLTADLAGLQFTDVESQLLNINPSIRRVSSKFQASKKTSQRTFTNQPVHNSRSDASANIEKSSGANGPSAPGGGYEEQMVMSVCDQNNEADAAKDVQETNDDATMLKRFRILALIGTGNYARVYKALSIHGKELAVKAINLSKTSENYRTKFLPRELTILKKINHINICKTHEIIQVADRIFIVMQYCPRGTIADLLHTLGPLSEPVARNLFAQTVDAIIYMHSIDMAHRDLKVENILLDQDFCPKLTDFSYSVHLANRQNSIGKNSHGSNSSRQLKNLPIRSPIRLSETFCGTLPYLSPEMIRQNPYDSKKTDVWSLGVCLYVMLNDRLPFPFNDIRLMVKKQLAKDYKFKTHNGLSDQLKDLVGLMLEPEVPKRITSYEISRHPWMSGPREKPPL